LTFHQPQSNLRGGAAQQHTPTAAVSSTHDCTGLARHSGRNGCPAPLRHNQQVPRQSIQTPNVNSSSLKDMFDVVTTVFQQIMTELNGVDSDEERTVAIIKIVLKLVK
jgi:hypothetical protein